MKLKEIIHIVSEIVVFGVISYYLSRRITLLSEEVEELKKQNIEMKQGFDQMRLFLIQQQKQVQSQQESEEEFQSQSQQPQQQRQPLRRQQKHVSFSTPEAIIFQAISDLSDEGRESLHPVSFTMQIEEVEHSIPPNNSSTPAEDTSSARSARSGTKVWEAIFSSKR